MLETQYVEIIRIFENIGRVLPGLFTAYRRARCHERLSFSEQQCCTEAGQLPFVLSPGTKSPVPA